MPGLERRSGKSTGSEDKSDDGGETHGVVLWFEGCGLKVKVVVSVSREDEFDKEEEDRCLNCFIYPSGMSDRINPSPSKSIFFFSSESSEDPNIKVCVLQ